MKKNGFESLKIGNEEEKSKNMSGNSLKDKKEYRVKKIISAKLNVKKIHKYNI